MSARNHKIIWVPPGCAHGFIVLSKSAVFLYKTTEYWIPKFEKCIIWNDKDLNIDWNLQTLPIISKKDKQGKNLKEAELFK